LVNFFEKLSNAKKLELYLFFAVDEMEIQQVGKVVGKLSKAGIRQFCRLVASDKGWSPVIQQTIDS